MAQGTAIIALLAALAAGIFLLEPLQRHLAAGPDLVVTAPRSHGLVAGAPVWVAGLRAGRVTSVEVRSPGQGPGGGVVIRAELEEDAANHVRDGARAWIQRSSLLGSPVLVVSAGPRDGAPLDFGDTLRAEERVTGRDLLARTDTIRARLDSLRAVGEEVAELATSGDGTLGRLHRDTELRETLRRDLAAARRLAAALRDHPAPAALEGVRETGVVDSLVARGDRTAALLPRRSEALAGLGRSLATLEERLARLDSLTASGAGSLGRFRADGELREQIRLLREDLRRTPSVLFSDPFRWLRFRLF